MDLRIKPTARVSCQQTSAYALQSSRGASTSRTSPFAQPVSVQRPQVRSGWVHVTLRAGRRVGGWLRPCFKQRCFRAGCRLGLEMRSTRRGWERLSARPESALVLGRGSLCFWFWFLFLWAWCLLVFGVVRCQVQGEEWAAACGALHLHLHLHLQLQLQLHAAAHSHIIGHGGHGLAVYSYCVNKCGSSSRAS